uniref:7TM_GPCR_Srx domain-containing protein n=1 Tax=Steinernema glaseri TaxID=37863 RepID=A0A1I7Y2H9_9BILA
MCELSGQTACVVHLQRSMLPTEIYVDYTIQLVCATVAVILNPANCYVQLKHRKKREQFSMLFVHMIFHTFFAFSTIVWASAVLIQKGQKFIAWSGIIHMSLHPTIGVIDFFVSLDRCISIVYPIKYMVTIKNKIVIVATTVSTLLFSCVVILHSTSVNHRLPYPITMVSYANPRSMMAAYILSTSLIVANIAISAVFLLKLRRHLRAVHVLTVADHQRPVGKSSKLANTIVFYQIVIEAIFWVLPSLLKVATEYCFAVNLTPEIPTRSLMSHVPIVAIKVESKN